MIFSVLINFLYALESINRWMIEIMKKETIQVTKSAWIHEY